MSQSKYMCNQQDSHRKKKSSTQRLMMRQKNSIGRGKKAIRKNPAIEELALTIQTLSTNLVKQQPDIQVRLRKMNHIIIEQSKDAVLQQLKANLVHEGYSGNILQQGARYTTQS